MAKRANFCENSVEAFHFSVTYPLRPPKRKVDARDLIWIQATELDRFAYHQPFIRIYIPAITYPPQIAYWRAFCKSEEVRQLQLLYFSAALIGAHWTRLMRQASAGSGSMWMDRTSAMSAGEGRVEIQIHCFPASPTPSFGMRDLSDVVEPAAPKKPLYIRGYKSLLFSEKEEEI